MQRHQAQSHQVEQSHQDQNFIESAYTLYQKYEEYFRFYSVLPYKEIYNYVSIQLNAEFEEQCKQLKKGEYLISPSEEKYKSGIKAIVDKYINAESGVLNFADKEIAINDEVKAIKKAVRDTLDQSQDIDMETFPATMMESMDVLLDIIFEYRVEMGCQGFAIGEPEDLLDFFSEQSWFAKEVVRSFKADTHVKEPLQVKVDKFYEERFSQINEMINSFYKEAFKSYIEALGFDLSARSSKALNDLFERTFKNEFRCSPTLLLQNLRHACEKLFDAIEAEIEKNNAMEEALIKKEKELVKRKQRQQEPKMETQRTPRKEQEKGKQIEKQQLREKQFQEEAAASSEEEELLSLKEQERMQKIMQQQLQKEAEKQQLQKEAEKQKAEKQKMNKLQQEARLFQAASAARASAARSSAARVAAKREMEEMESFEDRVIVGNRENIISKSYGVIQQLKSILQKTTLTDAERALLTAKRNYLKSKLEDYCSIEDEDNVHTHLADSESLIDELSQVVQEIQKITKTHKDKQPTFVQTLNAKLNPNKPHEAEQTRRSVIKR